MDAERRRAAQLRSVRPTRHLWRRMERHILHSKKVPATGKTRRREVGPSQGRESRSDGDGRLERRGGHAGQDRRG